MLSSQGNTNKGQVSNFIFKIINITFHGNFGNSFLKKRINFKKTETLPTRTSANPKIILNEMNTNFISYNKIKSSEFI